MAVIVGHMVRDPEMRYTPQGHAVASFAVATNRRWTSNTNEEKEETEFHNVVAWNKLAELCSQLLKKGVRVYVRGRLQTRSWQSPDGVKHYRTEIIADDMVVLESRKGSGPEAAGLEVKEPKAGEAPEAVSQETAVEPSEDVPAEEIPF